MNISEATDLYTVLHWLGVDPLSNGMRRMVDLLRDGPRGTDQKALRALTLLAERAGKALQLTAPYASIEALVSAVGVLREVGVERARQDEKWGEQNHPDGTGPAFRTFAEMGRDWCQQAAANGELTWRDILREETGEAYAEQDAATLRGELVQVAAVAVAWIQAIDRRVAAGEASHA